MRLRSLSSMAYTISPCYTSTSFLA